MTMRTRLRALGAGLLLIGVASLAYADANAGIPGSADDPLVTKSYVDEKLEALRAELRGTAPSSGAGSNAPAGAPTSGSGSGSGSSGASGGGAAATAMPYQVLALKPGDILRGGSGTMLIVRTGKALAIGNAGGNGLSDVTAGIDVKDGQPVKYDHLLVVPSKDGRGIRVVGDATCYVTVWGPYEIVRGGSGR
ncbi:hypothetical protein AB1399_03695 [Hydrogenibacillus schlegelii]|uniref:Uncharacterized protein n=1 Tax=Hydrogenibacillus schlegelii TaxID=1484 RepID=A0A179IQK8_HYDSH|nr:hypothetical protein [Hydrogenibacillus schlegelii]OAR04958.1 hypothetical protein SA87_10190 [Hydrogenibacillus schlegelii]